MIGFMPFLAASLYFRFVRLTSVAINRQPVKIGDRTKASCVPTRLQTGIIPTTANVDHIVLNRRANSGNSVQ
jgi:hypothetical protein